MKKTSAVRPITSLDVIRDQASMYVQSSMAPATMRSYTQGWSDFQLWCLQHELSPLPASAATVALYLTDRASIWAVATLRQRLTTINRAHELAGHPVPRYNADVQAVWRGIKRKKGQAARKVTPITTEILEAMLRYVPANTPKGMRDRALLLVGFTGAFRRAELTGLQMGDIEFVKQGLVIYLIRSKNDQDGRGLTKGIPYATNNPNMCAVRALKAWLKVSGITNGSLFPWVDKHGRIRSDRGIDGRSVARIVQDLARKAQIPGEFSGLSLRSGFATSAILAGMSDRKVMQQTGHRSLHGFQAYVRRSGVFVDNAVDGLGL